MVTQDDGPDGLQSSGSNALRNLDRNEQRETVEAVPQAGQAASDDEEQEGDETTTLRAFLVYLKAGGWVVWVGMAFIACVSAVSTIAYDVSC